jgi:hypothetical protein
MITSVQTFLPVLADEQCAPFEMARRRDASHWIAGGVESLNSDPWQKFVGLLEELIDVGRKGKPRIAEIERRIGNGAPKGSMDRIAVYGHFAVSSGQDRVR